MKTSLHQAVQAHLHQHELSDEQLRLLQQCQAQARPPARARPRLGLALAASLVLALMVALPLALRQPQDLVDEIAAEVVHNHLRLKPLEVRADNLEAVGDYFTQLDFRLAQTALLQGEGLQLLGGRYCSLQGITAAQLRLQDNETGTLQTLYQTRYDPAIFKQLPKLEEGAPPRSTYIDGIKVQVWVEKGLLFARTEDEGIASEAGQ